MNFFVSIDRNKKTDVMCPKGRTQNRNGGKMKKKAVEKVEMKESLLKGEALALNDAELEGAAGGGITIRKGAIGGADTTYRERFATQLTKPGTGIRGPRRVGPDDEKKNQPQSPFQLRY
ncbi:hypothetical protein D3Z60_17755 [Lachnospiraceae bacterium]|nr:hypothetical protein [Lachnospiraceae bacterium]